MLPAMWRGVLRWVLRLGYLAVLGALFGLSAYVAFSLFIRRGVTAVPTLVGSSLEEARQVAADHGLVLGHDPAEDRYAAEVPPDRVLDQQPEAGSLAKRGGRIDVVLSRGRERVAVPDLAGQALPAARVTLAGLGLAVGEVRQIFATAPEGTVAAQEPAGGREVDRQSPVDLYLVAENRGETYLMPDLIDHDVREVRRFFEGHGFRIGSVKYEPYEGIRDPVVLRQYPLPGHPLRHGEVISLVVAAAPELGGAA
jgi:serine/threonine-protein kinase